MIEKHVRERKEKAGLRGARRGKEAAALDAAGAALGSFGLAAFGLMIWLMIVRSPASALALAAMSWLAVAMLAWQLRRWLSKAERGMGDRLLPLPLTGRSVHLCVDMQRTFSAEGPWPAPWMDRVLPVAAALAKKDALDNRQDSSPSGLNRGKSQAPVLPLIGGKNNGAGYLLPAPLSELDRNLIDP